MVDYTEHKKLYLLCFTDDTEEDADLLFKNVFSKAKMVSKTDENGLPIAMLFLMDAKIVTDGIPLDYYYLYAACTHPEHRGRGIMANLLEEAKEIAIKDNKSGIFLKPANPPLFNFYAKSNFLPYFNVCKINSSSEDFIKLYPTELLNAQIEPLEEWYTVRKDFLDAISSPYVDFSKEILTTAADGSTSVIADDFGFVYEVRDSLLLVKEALCKKGYIKELFSAISYILKETNCSSIEIRLPPLLIDQLTDFKDVLQPFSVMWFTPKANQPNKTNGHHGFAFD